MSEWGRFDANYYRNPKIIAAGRDARDLHFGAIQYAVANDTDGFVPDEMVDSLDPFLKRSRAQTACGSLFFHGLFRRGPGGFYINGFDEWQRSRDEAEKYKRQARERQKKARASRASGDTERQKKPENPPASRDTSRDSHVTNDVTHHVMSRAQSRAGSTRTASKGRTVARGAGLPIEKSLHVRRLVGLIGDHCDQGTEIILASLALRVPESSLAKAAESLQNATEVRNRAAYIVGALQSELDERTVVDLRKEIA